MNNFIMVGNHCLNLAHVAHIVFPDDDTALVYFAHLEAQTCHECGKPAEGLEQAWMVLEGEDAAALRRFMGRAATDARTPVPEVFQQPSS
jgi:hypothetical protein